MRRPYATARVRAAVLVALLLPLALPLLGCGDARPGGDRDPLAAVTSPDSVAWADEPRTPEDMARMVGYFPNVTLTTHEGVRVRFYDDLVRDKTVVVSLMYTSCRGVCPLTIANLLQVKEALGERAGRDVFFYALTLDPVVDTPEVLKAYAESVGTGRGFTFLTGAGADIDLVRRRLGLYNVKRGADADNTGHGAVAAVGNERLGRWCHVLALVRPERILRTLQLIVPPPA